MRVFLGLAILAGIWIGLGAPVPFLSIDPRPVDPDQPTFKEAIAEEERQAAVVAPASAENPERRKLRQAVLRAAKQLEVSPCNANFRKRFVAAVKPFVRSIENGPPEIAVVSGREENLSKKFDKPALDKVFDAMMKGYLDPREFGGWAARMLGKGPSAQPIRCTQ